jgi:hypothetical protein
MHRTNIYLDEDQRAALRRLSAARARQCRMSCVAPSIGFLPKSSLARIGHTPERVARASRWTQYRQIGKSEPTIDEIAATVQHSGARRRRRTTHAWTCASFSTRRSGLKPTSAAGSIINAWGHGDFEALYYGEMLVDIGNALVHLDEPKDAIEEYLLTIGRHATLIVIHHQDMGIRDVHDNMGLETAIYGSAEYLVP